MPYNESNIEDWDFQTLSRTPGSPGYDAEAELFLLGHRGDLVVVEEIRHAYIQLMLDSDFAYLDDDQQHVRLYGSHKSIRGLKSGASRFTSIGRLERKVVDALGREHQKYGRIRLTLLPPEGIYPAMPLPYDLGE